MELPPSIDFAAGEVCPFAVTVDFLANSGKTMTFFDQDGEPIRTAALLMYGGGLRLLECLSLRMKDVDFDRREIVVRGGKGDKDRPVPLPDTSVFPLRALVPTISLVPINDSTS